MTRRPRVVFGALLCFAGLGLLLVIAAACSSGPPAPPPSVVPTAPPTGGTERVAMDLAGYEAEFAVQDSNGATTGTAGWDPAIAYDPRPWEIFRCCLLRTLMSYNGRSLQQGGAVLQPDLAINYPSISADGLTWTFHLRQGVRYAPPMADKEIVAQDFVRAMERAMRPDPSNPGGSYAFFVAPYLSSVITGGTDFATGSATSISGVETPDNYTLAIHLVQPTGDLGARLALPAFAPLPAGAADGANAGYGPFLVASGPYMIQGSDQLDPSVPLAQQPTPSGYVPGDHMYLVRNPSWDRSTDLLRGAFADRIEITNLTNDDSDPTKVTSAIEAGQADVSMDADLASDEITSLRADAAVAPRVHVTPGLLSHYIDMNLALAPFDDIHVRRAVEFATNKHSIATSLEPNSITQSHAIPDAFENGLLNDYAPFTSAGDAGDMAAAKAEMAQSPYDSNHDGVCDNAVCQSISMPTHDDGSNVQMESAAQTFESNLAQIGLQVTSSAIASGKDWYASLAPAQHAPVSFDVGWTTDYLSADGMFGQSATSTAISDPLGNNFSLIGATRDQLAQYGYSVTSAPSVDAGIQSCSALSGADSFGCWSQIDQYVTQRIVAWIPLSMTQTARLTSTAITAFDFDASLTEPSLSQIQVAH